MKDKKQTDPMEEAYKQLDGAPAGDAVSKAAQGEKPDTDFKQQEDYHKGMVQRFESLGGSKSELAQIVNDAKALQESIDKK